MRRVFIFLLVILSVFQLNAVTLSFGNTSVDPVAERPGASSGLEGVYVFRSLDGVSCTVAGIPAGAAVKWELFDNRGASFATAVAPGLISGGAGTSTITELTSDRGYRVYINDSPAISFWVIDYSAHPCTVRSIEPAAEQVCGTATLNVDGEAPRLSYCTITGRSYELSRDIRLEYRTQQPDPQAVRFITADTVVSLPYVQSTINIGAPLCDTQFHLSADRFLRAWGEEMQLTSSMLTASTVDAMVTASQKSHDSDNEIGADDSSGELLGGSAPAEITFEAAVTDAAIYHEWLLAKDPEFYDVILRTSDMEFTHIFTDMGTYYAKFTADNAMGSCAYESEVYTVSIGESSLLCPNAFSPAGSEGVNDMWKVSYKSIVEFECYIFNSWGVKLAEFHDPSQGWDGRYRGKVVNPGVYYYVIKARGSDGRQYNLSGDINIIGYNKK